MANLTYDRVVKIIFLVMVFFSFIFHAKNRNDHFQEMDSFLPYSAIYGFPEMARSQLPIHESSNVRKEFGRKIFVYLRGTYIGYLEKYGAGLPHCLRSAFILPFSSTYSFGHGLVYGFLSTSDMSYDKFMSRNIFFNAFFIPPNGSYCFFCCRFFGS